MLAILFAVVICGWMTTSCCLQVAQFNGELSGCEGLHGLQTLDDAGRPGRHQGFSSTGLRSLPGNTAGRQTGTGHGL